MLAEKRMQKILDRIVNKIHVPTSIIDITGTVVASSERNRIGQLEPFIKDIYEKGDIQSFRHDGATYARFLVDRTIPYYLAMDGTTQAIENYCLLTASLFDIYFKSSHKKESKETMIRQYIYNQVDEIELEDYCNEYKLDIDTPRCAFIIETLSVNVQNIFDILTETFPRDRGDMWIAVDGRTIMLMKSISEDIDDAGLVELAGAMEDTILNEVSIKAHIGVGRIKADIFGIRDSYSEAKKAVEIGRIYNPNDRIYVYEYLFLERFLHEVPADVYERFYGDVFYRNLDKVFNDEMILTIEKFFENSLNLSETSRQLYIHRNTLVYRLDKIQKVMGLDLRNFHDAVTFKIIMMMDRHVQECLH